MKRFDLHSYLLTHDHPQKQVDAVREIISQLDELKARGLSGDGYSLVHPFGERRSFTRQQRIVATLNSRCAD